MNINGPPVIITGAIPEIPPIGTTPRTEPHSVNSLPLGAEMSISASNATTLIRAVTRYSEFILPRPPKSRNEDVIPMEELPGRDVMA